MAKQTAFKEKENHQLFLNDNGEWERCDESKIHELWTIWVVSANAKAQHPDKDGYMVYEYISK